MVYSSIRKFLYKIKFCPVRTTYLISTMKELPTLYAAASCYAGIILLAFCSGFPSPTAHELLSDGLLTKSQFAIFASISHIGSILPFVLTLFYKKKPEIKIVVIFGSILGSVAWYLIATTESAAYLILGMLLASFQNGLNLICLPGYLAEVCTENRKKVYSAGVGFAMRVGILFVYLVGVFLPFRWLAILGMLVELIFMCLMVFNPYSPVWLVERDLLQRAKHTLEYLHGSDFAADQEINNLRSRMDSITESEESWYGALNALRRWEVVKPILIVSFLTFFKEMGGHEAMVTLSSQILEAQAGLDPRIAALFYPIFLIFGGIISLCIANRCNLKLLLIVTTSLQALAHLSMSIFFLVSVNYLHCDIISLNTRQLCTALSFWPISSVALYAFSFTLGWGTVIFVLFGIMFTSYKEFSFSIIALVTSFSSYATVVSFFYLLQYVGGFLTFLLLTIILVAAVIFQCIFLQI